MDIILDALKFDFPYLLVAIALVIAVGFPIMNKVLTPGINLRDALFEKDNPVAGLETAGFLLALLYVAYSAITGPSLASFAHDVGAAAVAVVVSIVLVIIARTILSGVVKSFNKGLDLNDEIFNQKNYAAAAVSIALMMGIVNGMTEENTLGSTPVLDAVIAGTILLSSMCVLVLYRFTHMRGASFMKEFFADDNPAAGVSLIGFAFACNYLLASLAETVRGVENIDMLITVVSIGGFGLVLILVLALIRGLLVLAINLMQKTSMHDEIFEQNNVGAAFMDAALTVGSAILLAAAFLG